MNTHAIAQQLGRSTNAVRNLRHRTNIKTRETQSIQDLNQENQKLSKQARAFSMLAVGTIIRSRE